MTDPRAAEPHCHVHRALTLPCCVCVSDPGVVEPEPQITWTTIDIADQFQRFVRKPELDADARWVPASILAAEVARRAQAERERDEARADAGELEAITSLVSDREEIGTYAKVQALERERDEAKSDGIAIGRLAGDLLTAEMRSRHAALQSALEGLEQEMRVRSKLSQRGGFIMRWADRLAALRTNGVEWR